MMPKNEFVRSDIYEGLLLKGSKRYYIEDLTSRDYFLENTTPYALVVLDTVILESSWGTLLVKTLDLLLDKIPKTEEELLDFRTGWSKKAIFSVMNRTNHKPLRCGLFFNCNHTARHSCWLLQDLMDFFGVDKSTLQFVIHRSPAAEPKAVRQYMRNDFESGFRNHMMQVHKKTKAESDEIIDMIEKCLNGWLAKQSPSYNDFFLFDEYSYAYNYCKKTNDYLEGRVPYATRRKFAEILKLLLQYYAFRKTEGRI